MSPLYNDLATIMEDVFAADDIVLKPETTAEDVDEWDSLNHIRFMLAVQDHFGINFSTAEISNLKNVGQLVELIESRT